MDNSYYHILHTEGDEPNDKRTPLINQFEYMKQSKRIILSTNTFNRFMRSYHQSKQDPVFKLPSIHNKLPSNPLRAMNEFLSINRMCLLAESSSHYEPCNTEHSLCGHSLHLLKRGRKKEKEISEDYYFNEMSKIKTKDITFYLQSHCPLKENSTSSLKIEKEITQSALNTVHTELSIDSITIEVSEKENSTINKKIALPFDILPFFYCMPLDIFLLFLSQVLPSFTTISDFTIDYETLKSTIVSFLTACHNLEPNSSYYQNVWRKFSVLKYNWITREKIYVITILPPRLKCILKNTSKDKVVLFNLILEQNDMIFLLMKKFLKWDVFCLSLLKSYKIFRNIYNCLNSSFHLDKDQCYINLSKRIEHLKKMNYYEFFISNGTKTNYMQLYSYQCNVKYKFDTLYDTMSTMITTPKTEANENIFEFKFDTKINDIKPLYSLYMIDYLEEFIRKTLSINHKKKKIEIDQNIYKTLYDTEFIREVEPINYKNGKHISIEVKKPRIVWKEIVQKENADCIELNDTVLPLSHRFILILTECKISEWDETILENINEINNSIRLKLGRTKSITKPKIKRKLSKKATLTARSKKKMNTCISIGFS